MSINVGVFFGGRSVEHEVSIISALQAIHSFDRQKYTITPIYITKSGVMYTGNSLLDIENYKDIPSLLAKCTIVGIVREGNEVIGYRIPPRKLKNNLVFKLDIAFPIIHGTNCEDGSLQGLFEMLELPYCGSGINASALGMDKDSTKCVLKESGISVLDHIAFYSRQWIEDSDSIIKQIEEQIGYPLIVKPSNLGSSVGISKASDRKQLEIAVDLAQDFSYKILVERAVTGLREINCSVLGDTDSASASVCEEPFGSDEILSYSDKYMSKTGASKGMQSLKRKIPADIPADLEQEIRETAVKAFKLMGCNGVVRIDFIIDTEDNNKVYINEFNTIPGSLAFYLWEATGKPYSQLLDDCIELGLKRSRDNQRLTFTYDTNILSLQGKNGYKGTKH